MQLHQFLEDLDSQIWNFLMWLLSHPIFLFLFGLFALWIVWVCEHRPKSVNAPKEVYIDDSEIRKVEVLECTFDWGTRLFPFRHLKILDAPVSATILIRYTPQGGLETDLSSKYYEDIPMKNKIVKPLKIKGRKFFHEGSIDRVKVFIRTPFERDKYATNVKHELKGNVLRIWNENAEEIRNFRFLLDRPIKLKGIKVSQGALVGVQMEIAYPALKSLVSRKIGTATSDVTKTLILNLPSNNLKKEGQVLIKLSG